MQFARQGIRVNALCPGPVNTPLLQELFAKNLNGPLAAWCMCRWAGSPSPTKLLLR